MSQGNMKRDGRDLGKGYIESDHAADRAGP